jgi:hypothetical protein
MSEEREPIEGEDIDLGEPDELDAPDGPDAEPPEPEADLEPAPPEPEPPRRPTQVRRDERFRERARDLESQNADLARRLADLERRQTAPPPPDPAVQARDEAEFRARLDQLSPAEAALEVANRSERRLQQQMMQAELRGFDRSDVAEFTALRARDRYADRQAAEVERVLQQRRGMGDYTLGRLDILDWLRGRDARLKGPAAGQQQRRAAAGRVAGQTVRPQNGAGDVGRTTGTARNRDPDEALLKQVTTSDIGW